MTTVTLNIENNTIVSEVSELKGVKEAFVRTKTKTGKLLELMADSEDIDKNEHLDSILGMRERIKASSNEPAENRVPIEEV